jgi:hypothetical protein
MMNAGRKLRILISIVLLFLMSMTFIYCGTAALKEEEKIQAKQPRELKASNF